DIKVASNGGGGFRRTTGWARGLRLSVDSSGPFAAGPSTTSDTPHVLPHLGRDHRGMSRRSDHLVQVEPAGPQVQEYSPAGEGIGDWFGDIRRPPVELSPEQQRQCVQQAEGRRFAQI